MPLTPEGKDDVVIARAAGATTSFRVTDIVCAGLDESVTLKVKLLELLVVGCPEMVPVDAERPSPDGRVPELRDHVYGAAPPLACRTVA